MFGLAIRPLGNKGLIDLGAGATTQFNLGFLGGVADALESLLIARQINTAILFEFADDIVDQAMVKVVASQERVTIGGFDFKDAVANFEDTDVKGAASQIVHGNFPGFLFVQAVG